MGEALLGLGTFGDLSVVRIDVVKREGEGFGEFVDGEPVVQDKCLKDIYLSERFKIVLLSPIVVWRLAPDDDPVGVVSSGVF